MKIIITKIDGEVKAGYITINTDEPVCYIKKIKDNLIVDLDEYHDLLGIEIISPFCKSDINSVLDEYMKQRLTDKEWGEINKSTVKESNN